MKINIREIEEDGSVGETAVLNIQEPLRRRVLRWVVIALFVLGLVGWGVSSVSFMGATFFAVWLAMLVAAFIRSDFRQSQVFVMFDQLLSVAIILGVVIPFIVG